MDLVASIESSLRALTANLERCQVHEVDQVYGRRGDLLGRGQAAWPVIEYSEFSDTSLQGKVTVDRHFLGRNGVIHGGITALLFDEIVGRLAHSGCQPRSRTASLRVDFRSPAAIEIGLRIFAELRREEGRKRFFHAELHDHKGLCAEAEILMVTLKPGQT